MEPIINAHLLAVGTRVALKCRSRNGYSVYGNKDNSPITISKIKEDGSIYLKGETAPMSVPFKLKPDGTHEYHKSELYSFSDYTIITVESAKIQAEKWAEINRINKAYDEAVKTALTTEQKQAVIELISSMKK